MYRSTLHALVSRSTVSYKVHLYKFVIIYYVS